MFTSSSFGGPTKPNLTSGEAASQQGARKLTRKFSLEERDSSGVDQKDLSNLQKVSLPAVLCCAVLCCTVLCCAVLNFLVSNLNSHRLSVVLNVIFAKVVCHASHLCQCCVLVIASCSASRSQVMHYVTLRSSPG